MRVLAIEWARYGIKPVAVAPGIVDTDTFRTKYSAQGVEHSATSALSRRLVAREDVARAIAFLASPGGDAITGGVIDVDAGHDVHQTRLPFPALSDRTGRPWRRAAADETHRPNEDTI